MHRPLQNATPLLVCGVLLLMEPLAAKMVTAHNPTMVALAANTSQVRLDADGPMQRTAVSALEQKEMRGLRGKLMVRT